MKNSLRLTQFEVMHLFKGKLLPLYSLFFSIVFVISAIFFKLYGSDGSVLTHPSGQSFPIQHLQSSLTFMAIFVAIYVGSITIEDRSQGTIKLPLLRSVSRWQYYVSRILSIFIFTFLLTMLIILVGYVVGFMFFGWGNEFVFNGVQVTGLIGITLTFASGLAYAFVYSIFGLLCLVISLYIDRIATLAMIAAASTLVGQYVVTLVKIRQYIIFYQLLYFHSDWFNQTLFYNVNNVLVLIGYLIITVVLGFLLFNRKDLHV